MAKRRKHIIGLLLGLLCLLLLLAGLKSCDSKVQLPGFNGNLPSAETSPEAKKVDDLINAIKTPITLESADAIAAARKAYDALSDADKDKVTLLDKLKGFELDLNNLMNGGSSFIADNAAELDKLLNGIKLPLTAEGIDLLGKIREAFNNLPEAEKLKFKGLNLLEGLELGVNSTAADLESILNGINLPRSVTEFETMAKAKAAYDAMPESEREKLQGFDFLKDFNLKGLSAPDLNALLNSINLPRAQDADLLAKIREAYEALPESEKPKFDLNKLKGFEFDLSSLLNGNTPEAVDDLIKGIPVPITLQSEDLLNKALAAYNALSDEDKTKVKNFDLLNSYLQQLQDLKNAGNSVPKTGVE